MIRKAALSLLLSFACPNALFAAEEARWVDVFAPDRLAELGVQYGLQVARGFADVTYEDLNLDILAQRGHLSGLVIYPFPEWEGGEECRITVASAEIIGTPLATVDEVALSLRVQDLDAPLVCLPTEMRLPVMAAGLDRVTVDSIEIATEYRVPSASLRAVATLSVPDLATAQAEVDFEYVSYWVREAPITYPVLYMRSGSVTVEDQGGWDRLRNLLPPRLLSPETGGTEFAGLAREVFAASPGLSAEDAALRRFLTSLETAWQVFLRDGGALSLTLGDPDGAGTYVDLEALEVGQENPFELFSPRVVAGAAHFAAPLDRATLTAAANGELEPEAAFEVAVALDKGQRVPRNRAAARDILERLSALGYPPAQTALALAMVAEDGPRAYALALRAAEQGYTEAVRALDEMERDLSARVVLDAQGSTGAERMAAMAPRRAAGVFRDHAEAALSGLGARRSYADALVWGLLGQAMHDLESARIVRDVEARLAALNGSQTRALVAVAEERALRLWTEMAP